MQQINVTSEKLTKKNIIDRVSDVPAGVSLNLSTLVSGNVVQEGTPLTKPSSGKRTVCKQAIVLTGSTTTVIKVESGTHHFKVGDFIGTKTSGKAYAITGITTADGVDSITVGTAIDTPTVGGHIYEMTEESASNTSTLKNVADTVLKSPFEVPSDTQVIFIKDALIIGSVIGGFVGSEYLDSMKGIVEVYY